MTSHECIMNHDDGPGYGPGLGLVDVKIPDDLLIKLLRLTRTYRMPQGHGRNLVWLALVGEVSV